MAVIQIEMWYARLGCHGLCSGSIEQVHEKRAPPVVESDNGVQTRGPLAIKDASHQDPVENDNEDDEKLEYKNAAFDPKSSAVRWRRV